MFKNFMILAMLTFSTFFSTAHSSDMQTTSATLFYSPTCGHCQQVLSFLNQNHKTVNMKNIKENANAQELHALGPTSVPVLVVNGNVIVGGDGIIDYLKSH